MWVSHASAGAAGRSNPDSRSSELSTSMGGCASGAASQGLTLAHFSAQLERFSLDRGCT